MKVGRFSTVALVLVCLVTAGLLLFLPRVGRGLMFGVGGVADLSGFLALGFIAATGVMMLFKGKLSAWMGSPERLWRLHIAIAAAGGVFLGIHVVLLLDFPVSLPVFFGYIATGVALLVWITGGVYFQGVRNSAFFHGLLSMGAVLLMVLHAFDSGRNIPMVVAGLSLAFAALLIVVGVGIGLSRSWKAERPRT